MKNKEIEIKKREFLLSSERTFLSYIRTSASVLVLSVALFKFFENKVIIYIGYFCLVLGFLIVALGLYRYSEERKRIKREEFEIPKN